MSSLPFLLPHRDQWVLALIIGALTALLGYLLAVLFSPATAQILTTGMGLGSFIGAVLAFSWRGFSPPTAATSPTPEAIIPAISSESRTIFVGNLAFKANSEQIRALFGQYGEVRSVRIMTDRMTRRPRGFAFIEMEGNGALRAIQALNGYTFFGRDLRVNEGHNRRNEEDLTDPNSFNEA